MGLTSLQSTSLVLLTKISGFISMGLSSLMLIAVIRLHRKNPEKTYSRLLGLISVVDIILSCSAFFATWPIPRGQALWSYGNDATCWVQGAVIQFSGITSFGYQWCLSTYFLLVIRFGWSERRVRTVEPYMHALTWGLGLVTTSVAAAYRAFNPAILWCFIGPREGVVGDVLTFRLRWLCFYMIAWSIIILIIANTTMIFLYVRRLDQKSLVYKHTTSSQLASSIASRSAFVVTSISTATPPPAVTMRLQSNQTPVETSNDLTTTSRTEIESSTLGATKDAAVEGDLVAVDQAIPSRRPVSEALEKHRQAPMAATKEMTSEDIEARTLDNTGALQEWDTDFKLIMAATKRLVGQQGVGNGEEENDDGDETSVGGVVAHENGKVPVTPLEQSHIEPLQVPAASPEKTSTSHGAVYSNKAVPTLEPLQARSSRRLKRRSTLAKTDPANDKIREVATQSFCYVGAFFFTWTGLSLLRLVQALSDASIPYWITLLAATTAPVQGLPNLLIFLRPKALKLRRLHPGMSWVRAMAMALWQSSIATSSSCSNNSGLTASNSQPSSVEEI